MNKEFHLNKRQGFIDRAEQIIQLLNEELGYTRNAEQVTQLYASLKDDLQADAKKYKTQRGKASATESEEQYYMHYILQADAYDLEFRRNAPPSPKLLQCMLSLSMTLDTNA